MNETQSQAGQGGTDPKPKSRKVLNTVSILVLVVLACLVSWFIFTEERQFASTAPNTATSTATTTVTIGGITFIVPPGAAKPEVEQINIPPEKLPPAPNLNRPVVFPSDFPQEAQSTWKSKFDSLKKIIAANPGSYDAWVQIGLNWKMIADYQGAKEAWEYATKISPTSSVAFGDLGFLYGYYLHDTVKAEANYKSAIANAPQELYLYQQLFEFYRDILKDTVKARALAAEGKKITGNVSFFDQLLSTLK